MDFEQPNFMGARMKREKGGDREEESAKSILDDPEREDIKLAVMERRGQEDLSKKLVNKQTPDKSDFEDLTEIANEIKRVEQEVKQMESFFGDGKLFNEIATVDKDFGQWQTLIGSENMESFYNKEYFIKLCLDDEASFKNIKKKVERYNKTREKIEEADQGLEVRANQLADKFRIPQDELKNIFNMGDDAGRKTALKDLIKENIKPLMFKGEKRTQVYDQLQRVLVDGDKFIKDLRSSNGVLGGQEKKGLKGVATSLLKDEEWKEASEKRAGEVFTGESPEKKEKTMSFPAASRMVKEEGRKKIQEDWTNFQKENAMGATGRSQEEIAAHWSQLTDEELKRKQDRFLKGVKKSQGGGYWWGIVMKIANFDLTKEVQGS
ncbi:MAG: hypothetical protein U9Q72_01510 [Patescibacteria group bacterium]|nr:hypothetical protein [Patescibacteria group bacterium]